MHHLSQTPLSASVPSTWSGTDTETGDDQVKFQFAVRWNLTMGLYWIRPYTFINLDSRNREFMSNPDNISANVVAEMKSLKSVPAAEKYLSIRDKCQAAIDSGEYGYSSFPELSYCKTAN